MFSHIDADAFFASVLVRKYPHLRGKPLLALGMGGGCVIAASYEAKACGVRTGMRFREAQALCPGALSMPSDFHEAARASQEIEDILRNTCPFIEQMSVDEWYMDLRGLVGGMPSSLGYWGEEMQTQILRKTGLSVSVGIAETKLLAKMAGEFRKPAGVTVIPVSTCSGKLDVCRQEFLAQRPAAAIPGIGRKRVRHTDQRGWTTALHIAEAPTEELQALFGKNGVELQAELCGRPIEGIHTTAVAPQSVSRCRSFRSTNDRDQLWAHLLKHAEYVIMKMRRDALACRGCSIWLRTGAYEHGGLTISLPQAMDTVEALTPYLQQGFISAWQREERYTQVGLALWHLVTRQTEQYSLFHDVRDQEKSGALQQTMDRVHTKFGRNALTRASALQVKSGTNMGFSSPLYGD